MVGEEREYDPIVEEYAADQAATTKKESTIAKDKSDIQQFLGWYDGNLSAVDSGTLKQYIGWLKADYPQSTALKKVNSVSSFFRFLVDRGTLENHPRDDLDIRNYLKRSRGKKRQELRARQGIVWLTREEFQQVLEHIPEPRTRNELLLRLMFTTGVRPGEATEIRVDSDVYRDERRIEIPTAKQDGYEIRDVWWPKSLDPLMNRYIDVDRAALQYADDSPYLFCSSHGEQLSSYRPNRVFKKAAGPEGADINEELEPDADGNQRWKYTAHSLRHSFAVHYVLPEEESGTPEGDIRSLQKLMGHSSIDVTEKYLDFKRQTLKNKMTRHGPDI